MDHYYDSNLVPSIPLLFPGSCQTRLVKRYLLQKNNKMGAREIERFARYKGGWVLEIIYPASLLPQNPKNKEYANANIDNRISVNHPR